MSDETVSDAQRSALIHREIFQIGVLIVVAIAVFVVTRAVATNNRDMNLRDAAEWYRRGRERLDAGQLAGALDAFRRAAVKDRIQPQYGLTLARTLSLNHDDEEARSVLLSLREASPENPEINLELARLAARHQDAAEATRFYHNALYAPWPPDQTEARRRIRFELIRFLMSHDQVTSALAELAAVSADVPDTAAARLEVAGLFADGGDYEHALEQFQGALRLAPGDGRVLAGAGGAAFQLGKYTLAKSYLRRAPPQPDEADMRAVLDLILSRDPLASRIGSTERRRRLVANLSDAQQRLTACLAGRPDGQVRDADAALAREVDALQDQLPKATVLDADTIEAGVDVTDRAARVLGELCGPPTALDRALVLIGRQHSTDAR